MQPIAPAGSHDPATVLRAATAASRPYGMACIACRRLKIKCMSSGLEAQRCDRCIKFNRACEIDPSCRRLRRRPDNNSSSANRRSQPEADVAKDPKPNSTTKSQTLPVPQLYDDQLDIVKELYSHFKYQTGPNLGNEASHVSVPSSRERSVELADDDAYFVPPSFVSQSEDTRTFSLDAAMDPERSLGTASSGSKGANSASSRDRALAQDDPINLGILNLLSSRHLFEGYFAHFEYNVGYLDPALYTFDNVRRNSSFLFTVLLSISARVFRPDLYAELRQHAEALMGRVLLTCDAAIENIWAIICMYYWKELGDNRGYTLVGFASRLAASSDWNGARRQRACSGQKIDSEMMSSEWKMRQRRDEDRAWLFLGSIDRTLCFFTDRPLATTMNPPETTSRAWIHAENNWSYGFGDARAMAGQELTDVAKTVHDFIISTRGNQNSSHEARRKDMEYLGNAMKEYNTNMIAWAEYWSPIFESHQTSVRSLEPQVQLYCNHLRTYFNSIWLHRLLIHNNNDVTDPTTTSAIQTCYSSSMRLLQETAKLGHMEILYYLWDTAHLMITYCAMVLLKVLKQAPNCPGLSVTAASRVLKEVADVHTVAAGSLLFQAPASGELAHATTPAQSTVEAQARLLRAIVFRVRAELLPKQQTPGNTCDDEEAENIGGEYEDPLSSHDSGRVNNSRLNTAAAAIQGPTTFNRNFQAFMGAEEQGTPVSPLLPLYMQQQQQQQQQQEGQHFPAEPGLLEDQDGDTRGIMPYSEFQMGLLLSDMDMSLDSSFMDSRFMDVGLLSWDELGMFKDPTK